MKKPRPAKSLSESNNRTTKAGPATVAKNTLHEPSAAGHKRSIPVKILTKAQIQIIDSGFDKGKDLKTIDEELKRLPEEPRETTTVTIWEDWFPPSLQPMVDQIMKTAPAGLKPDLDDPAVNIFKRLSCPPGMPIAVWLSLSPEQQAPFRKARGAWLMKENKRYEAKQKEALIVYGAPAANEYVRVLRRLHDVIGKELERVQSPKGGFEFLFAGGRAPDGRWHEMPWPAMIRDALPEYAKALKDIVAKQEKCIALRARACFNCGKPLPQELAHGKRRFCSLECSGAARAKRFRQKSATRKTANEKQKR